MAGNDLRKRGAKQPHQLGVGAARSASANIASITFMREVAPPQHLPLYEKVFSTLIKYFLLF